MVLGSLKVSAAALLRVQRFRKQSTRREFKKELILQSCLDQEEDQH